MKTIFILALLSGSAYAQLPSVLVTPRVQLDVQRIDSAPAQQAHVAQPQVVQPQVIYVQPPVPVDSYAARYLRYRAWFDAHYVRRGVFFPRYVRRCAWDPAFVGYHLYAR